MRNVLLVIDALSGGGAELVVYNLCRSIDRGSFRVGACCLRKVGGRGHELLELGYDIVGMPMAKCGLDRYLSFCRLRHLIRKKRIDIVHSHSTQGLVDCSMARMCGGKVKHIHTFHYGNYPDLDRRRLMMEKAFCRFPETLIAVGNEQRRTIEATFGLPGGRVETVWNGIAVDEPYNATRADLRTKYPEKVTFVTISTLIEQKGLPVLLDAIKLLTRRTHNFRVMIVGDGPMRKQLEKRSRELCLDSVVEFLGWIDNAAATVLPWVDVFVQPSLWEAMSMVVLEAMAAQKPVIVTDVGENRHVVQHHKNGLIVGKGDVAGMATCMEELIRNRALRERLGIEARKWVVMHCSAAKMARDYEVVYERVLGRNKLGRPERK